MLPKNVFLLCWYYFWGNLFYLIYCYLSGGLCDSLPVVRVIIVVIIQPIFHFWVHILGQLLCVCDGIHTHTHTHTHTTHTHIYIYIYVEREREKRKRERLSSFWSHLIKSLASEIKLGQYKNLYVSIWNSCGVKKVVWTINESISVKTVLIHCFKLRELYFFKSF